MGGEDKRLPLRPPSLTKDLPVLAFNQEVMEMPKGLKEKKKLMKVECDPECGFMVRDHDEKELIEMVKRHSKKFHDKEMTDKEIRADIEEA